MAYMNPNANVVLRPCPWSYLGGTHTPRTVLGGKRAYVECTCGARGPQSLIQDPNIPNLSYANEAWNRYVDLKPEQLKSDLADIMADRATRYVSALVGMSFAQIKESILADTAYDEVTPESLLKGDTL